MKYRYTWAMATDPDDKRPDPRPDTVALVLHRDAGERLIALSEHSHVWAVESPRNREAAVQIWSRPDRLLSMTLFHADSIDPDAIVAEALETIELHHGEASQSDRFLRLDVHGATLTPALHEALASYEFSSIERTSEGFTANRER